MPYLVAFGDVEDHHLEPIKNQLDESGVVYTFRHYQDEDILTEMFFGSGAYLMHNLRHSRPVAWGEGLRLREFLIRDKLGIKPKTVVGMVIGPKVECTDKFIETLYLISGKSIIIHEIINGEIRDAEYNGLDMIYRDLANP
jgi:hypothetical protein